MQFKIESYMYAKDSRYGMTFEGPELSSMAVDVLTRKKIERDLIKVLGFDPEVKCARFRDWEISNQAPLVRLRTKTGGVYNKQTFAKENNLVMQLPGFTQIMDWVCDSTYLIFEFSVDQAAWTKILKRYSCYLVERPRMPKDFPVPVGEPKSTMDMILLEMARKKNLINPCVVCEKQNQHLLCSVCHTARYCSKECQLVHWPQHKFQCFPKQ